MAAQFLDIFGVYAFAARSALVLALVAMAIFALLNAGIFALPQTGLLAVGAYTGTILSLDAQVSFGLAVAGGALSGMLLGMVLAGLLGRLNGIYLAIATLAFSEAVSAAVLNIPLTGAAQGRVGIPRATNDLAIVGAVLFAVVVLWALQRSRFGLAIVAMREDTLMARHQGIDVFSYRVGLFALSGLLCGLAGALNVHLTGFVEPGFFNFGLLSHLLAAVVMGGMIYVSGPLLGTALLFTLSQVVTVVGEYQALANGAIIVIVVAFAPFGLIGLFDDWLQRRRVRSAAHATGGNMPDGAVAGEPATPSDRASRRTAEVGAREPVIDLTDIAVSFGGIRALQGVSLNCVRGELLGIIGPNGSGKTTLLNVVSGVYKPTTGSGTLLGRSLTTLWGSPHLLARAGVARTFQTIRLVDSHSVRDNITIGLHGLGRGEDPAMDPSSAKSRAEVVAQLLRGHGLDHLADVRAGELSYGVRRRVEIARAVASRPKLLLLDEPTAGMDPHERAEVFGRIALLLSQGIAIIVVEHDVAMMAQYCDRLVVLDFGLVIAAGEPADVLQQESVIKAYVGGASMESR